MQRYYSFLIFTVLVIFVEGFEMKHCVDENCTLNHLENESSSRVLSRRKRFVIFPEGSSLQLVFCVQTSALIPIGDIFLYGNTAALAWNLPNDAKFFTMFKNQEDMQRRADSKKVVYYDEGGRIVQEVPYHKKPIINPAFAKRSIHEQAAVTYKEKLKIRLDRIRMHEQELSRDYMGKHHLTAESIDFHRKNRVDLYQKIEKLLKALGQDGRRCVLHKLCVAAKGRNLQGTFLQEFLRAVFTLPKGKAFEKEDHQIYDEAHDVDLDCNEKYNGCDAFNT